MADVQGKRALVTGGSAGIGRAIAMELVAGGARVAVAARTTATLEQVAAAIGAIPLVADLSTVQSGMTLASDALATLGGLDILVLCSGIYRSGTIAEQPDSDLAELLANNLVGPAALARALAPALIQSRGDVVVVNSSVVRAQNIKGRAYFAAGQHALRAFTDGLRDEINEQGVRVTSIFPGVTATPRQELLHETSGRPYRPEMLLQPRDVALAAMAALSLPHTAEATDIHLRPRYKS